MARTSWKQVRLEEALYRECSIVAASDGRSLTNWIEHTLKPIVAAALGDESANGAVEKAHEGMGSAEPPAAAATRAPARPSHDPVLARQAKLNKAKGL
jgi:hypothetical protein